MVLKINSPAFCKLSNDAVDVADVLAKVDAEEPAECEVGDEDVDGEDSVQPSLFALKTCSFA